ncbi:hypothetical protein CK203_066678 [Vitis vinifera]|uniref:Uncharacterized protein n=1 Tax=Vitis vinifera TaxID=29760 RepID=A0A438EVB1_VITVI|nr:hypothetical protein CK203_066678 [Vitis vinifera]
MTVRRTGNWKTTSFYTETKIKTDGRSLSNWVARGVLDFLKENGVDPSIYTTADSTPRYIRLKPGSVSEAQVQQLEAEFKSKLEKVGWLPNFYSLPPQIHIAKLHGLQGREGGNQFISLI